MNSSISLVSMAKKQLAIYYIIKNFYLSTIAFTYFNIILIYFTPVYRGISPNVLCKIKYYPVLYWCVTKSETCISIVCSNNT